MSPTLHELLVVLQWGILMYFMANTMFQVIILSLGALGVRGESLRGRAKAYAEELVWDWPGVSIIIPGFNEEVTIVTTVDHALRSNYPNLEVIVVDDGSTDRMFEVLAERYDLYPVNEAPQPDAVENVPVIGPVVGLYGSKSVPRLKVVCKENRVGRKADAVNAGLWYATNPFIAITDADSIFDARGVHLLMRDIVDCNQPVVVGGGVVKPLNGCVWDGIKLKEVRAPRTWLGRIQAVEYLRAFYYGRRGLAMIEALPFVSGAFSMYWRRALIDIGGLTPDGITEDLQVYFKIRVWKSARFRAGKAVFVTEPIVWTEVPESWRDLWHQRVRWHRGLLDCLREFRHHIGSPRLGSFGLVTMPYLLLFEAMAPLVEALGIVIFVACYILRVLNTPAVLTWLGVAFVVHICLSTSAVVLSDFSLRRYDRISDVVKLLLAAVVEQVSFRQFTVCARIWAMIAALRGSSQTWISPKRLAA